MLGTEGAEGADIVESPAGTETVDETLRNVLNQWKDGVDAHDPQRVADAFSTDAIFQGLRPFSVGQGGVLEYYDSQPAGMTVDFSILESRRLGADILLGYLDAVFTYPDRSAVHLRIGVVTTRTDGDWRITYYQASLAPK